MSDSEDAQKPSGEDLNLTLDVGTPLNTKAGGVSPTKARSSSNPDSANSSPVQDEQPSDNNDNNNDKESSNPVISNPVMADRVVVGRSTANPSSRNKVRITPASKISISISSLSKLHHAMMEGHGTINIALDLLTSATDTTALASSLIEGSEDKHRSVTVFTPSPLSESPLATDGGVCNADFDLSNLPDLTPAAAGKLALRVTVTRLVAKKDPTVVGSFLSPPFHELDFTKTTEFDLVREKEGQKAKTGRGHMVLQFQHNREVAVPTEEPAEEASKEPTEELAVEPTKEPAEEPAEEPSAQSTSAATAAPATKPAKSASPPNYRKIMFQALKDPEIAAAFKNPDLNDIVKKIQKDPTILADPMSRLKDEMEASPDAKAAALELLPKLQALLPKASTAKLAKKAAKASPPNYRKIMFQALKDPEIAAAFKNPDLKDIVKKIQKDPTILADPMNRLKDEIEASPAAKEAAFELLPKLQALLPASSPASSSASSPAPSPTPTPSSSTTTTTTTTTTTAAATLPMWENQSDLPRLPIPDLSATHDLFLEAVEPILSPDTYAATKASAGSFFSSSEATALQSALAKVDDAAPDHSWFHEFHNDMYMNARYPTFLYKNPCGVCKDELLKKAGITTQLDTAAHIICSMLVFARKVLNHTLSPDEFKGFPLDMLQYDRMFGTSRIPGLTRDTFLSPADRSAISHIVVVRDGRWWKLTFPQNSQPSYPQTKAALEAVLSACDAEQQEGTPAEDVGALTTSDRETWASNRAKLVDCSPDNATYLSAIDTALFVLCLDTPAEDTSLASAMHAAVHGDCKSRWFDKPLQLIITSDGKVCTNAEHSWGDGIALVRWGGELLQEIQSPSYITDSSDSPPVTVDRFQFSLSPSLISEIADAAEKAQSLAATWAFSNFDFKDFGADFFKQNGFSPDSVMQQIMQLAYFKQHKKMTSVYCVAQHMAFKAGRNERMRGSTRLAKQFIDSVDQAEDVQEQYRKLKESCERHSDLTRRCTLGFGFDRHMYALDQLANAAKKAGDIDKVPKIFSDDGFITLMTDKLCSSSLDAPFVEVMMALPAFSDYADAGNEDEDSDGKYFTVYMTRKNELRFCINGWTNSGDVDQFKQALLESINDVQRIIVKGSLKVMEEEATPTKTPAAKESKPKSTPSGKVGGSPEYKKIMMKDKVIGKMFADPKYAKITKAIMRDPTILADPLNRLAAEIEEGGPEFEETAKMLVERLSKIEITPPASAASSPAQSHSSSPASSERELGEISASPQSTKKQNKNSFSPTGSESSGEVLISQQTIEKKKNLRRVRSKKGAKAAEDDSSDSNSNSAADSRASSPAFSEDYINDSANAMMEEEITRAIALANQNKDLQDLTVMTSLFGDGSLTELKAALPAAKKYLEMANKRDAMKNKFKSKNQLTAASPRAARTAHSTGKNADGTPFSAAQIASMKRRRAAKEGSLTPPQASVYIQLIFRGHKSRTYMRRRHRSATKVSALFLGFLCRRETAKERKRWHKVLQDEKVRHTRIKRIDKERAELALLRRTPASRLKDVDGRRRGIAVRKIQRFFRVISRRLWFQSKNGKRGHVKRVGEDKKEEEGWEDLTLDIMERDRDREEMEGAIMESQASFWSRAGDKSLLESSEAFNLEGGNTAKAGGEDGGFLTPAIKRIRDNLQIKRGGRVGGGYGEMSALRLADLQRRVGVAAYENRREKERKEREAAYAAGVAAGKHGGGGVRRGYEKLIEIQSVVNQKLAQMALDEGEREKSKERRARRLARFDRVSSLLEKPPTLAEVREERKKRNNGEENSLKSLLSGWRLPREGAAWSKSKKAHDSTINALSKREEWWSLNLGEKYGGGTFDLRGVCDFDVDSEEAVGPMVGKYDEDESSLFWYMYSLKRAEGGGGSGAEKLAEKLYERTKLGEGEKIGVVDGHLREREKRIRGLGLGINKVLGREQQLRAAPGTLKGMKEGRANKIFSAAVAVQRMSRGVIERKRVGQMLSNVRVAGALKLLVEEMGGGGGGGNLGAVLSGILGPQNATATAPRASKREEKVVEEKEEKSGSRSLFWTAERKTGGRESKYSTPSSVAGTPVREKKSSTSVLGDTLLTSVTSVSSLGMGGGVGGGSVPSSPALFGAINEVGAGLRIETKEEGQSETPLMRGMLVNVDVGLGSADKPSVWKNAKVVRVNGGGDISVEFDEDGRVLDGVRKERVRGRMGSGGTPSTMLLERRKRISEGKTPTTVELERGGSYRSLEETGEGESKAGMNGSMLDDSLVLEALRGSDLATQAMSPNDRKRRGGSEEWEEGEKENVGLGSVIIPKLILPKAEDGGLGTIGTMTDGYVSPPSVSPVRSKRGEKVVGEIAEECLKMKEGRGGRNSNLYGKGFNSAREFESSARVRGALGCIVEGLGVAGGSLGGGEGVLMEILRKLDLDESGFVGVDDLVDVFRVCDAKLGLQVGSIADVGAVGVSVGLFLEKSSGGVNLKEVAAFVSDCGKERVGLWLGRLLVLKGNGRGLGGKEMIREVWGGEKVVDVGGFKRGVGGLKPKLGADEFEGLVKECNLGGGELVSLEKFEAACFPEGEEVGEGKGHRDLQKKLKKHFALDARMLNNLLLLCGDVDYEGGGGVEWKVMLRVLENSTLLLTKKEVGVLCNLLCRDGGVDVRYDELRRIAKGEVLSMPSGGGGGGGGSQRSEGSGSVSANGSGGRDRSDITKIRRGASGGSGRKLLGSGRKPKGGDDTPTSAKTEPIMLGGVTDSGGRSRLNVTFKEGSPEQR